MDKKKFKHSKKNLLNDYHLKVAHLVKNEPYSFLSL